MKVPALKQKIASLKEEMERLKQREREVHAHPDKQISETDPDSRLMKKSGMGSQVSYNVQTVVDTEHKLIVAHEVTNAPSDRGQLSSMAELAQQAVQGDELTVLADRGYYNGEEIRACYLDGIKVLVPKPLTSNNKAAGLFDKQDFRYDSVADQYRGRSRSIFKTGEGKASFHTPSPHCCRPSHQIVPIIIATVEDWVTAYVHPLIEVNSTIPFE